MVEMRESNYKSLPTPQLPPQVSSEFYPSYILLLVKYLWA